MDNGLWTLIELLASNRPLAMMIVIGVLLLAFQFVRRRTNAKLPANKLRSQPEKAARAVSPQAAVAGEGTSGNVAESQLMNETPAKNSIEVAEADPLAEAAVYLEFGYLDHAAQALRSFVDGAGRGNHDVLRKLLQIYRQLERIDDYADVLELLCGAGEEPEFVQAAILDGLTADIENLHLRVLAESYLELGPEKLSKLLGTDVVLEEEPKPVSSEAASALEVPIEPLADGVPAAMPKSSRPLRQVMQLIDGGMRLPSSFSVEEKAMLRVFAHPVHEARLHRAEARMHSASGKLDAAMEALRRAINARPQALVNFADLLWVLHRRKQLDEYVKTLWRLFWILNGAGRALRDRFLGMGLMLGQHPVLEFLMLSPDRQQLETIGLQYGLMPPEQVAPRKLHLVDASWQESDVGMSMGGDVFDEVNSFLEFGQIDQAIEVLEGAILDDPADARLYPTLLDLYDRMDDLDRLLDLSAKVRTLVQRPPEEVVPMMLNLEQRLQQRKHSSRRAKG